MNKGIIAGHMHDKKGYQNLPHTIFEGNPVPTINIPGIAKGGSNIVFGKSVTLNLKALQNDAWMMPAGYERALRLAELKIQEAELFGGNAVEPTITLLAIMMSRIMNQHCGELMLTNLEIQVLRQRKILLNREMY